MTRITVVKTDRYVCVDGKCFFDIDMSTLPGSLHAMQWYGSWGDEEYRDPETRKQTNVRIATLDLYVSVLAQWEEKSAAPEVTPQPEAPTVPSSISRRQCALLLLSQGMITGPEAVAMTRDGTPPSMVMDYVSSLEETQQYLALIDLAAVNYARDNPLLGALIAANGMTAEQVDQFFMAAVAL